MTDDAAVVRLGAQTFRGARRTGRKSAKFRNETRKLRKATEAQIRNHRDFLHIEEPEELLQPPAHLLPGQEWGLWVFDELYAHLAVIGVRDGIVVAQTVDGQLVAVEQRQLVRRGQFLGWVR
jgi:hypothetical protein